MSNLPPGMTQEIIDGHEHFEECLNQPLDAECICLDILESRDSEDAENRLEQYLLDQATEGTLSCLI